MNCPSVETLRKLLEERLEDAQRDAIEKHAESCAACQQRLAELSEATFALPGRRRLEYETDEAFLTRLKRETSGSSLRLGVRSTPSTGSVARASPPSVVGYEILHELGRGGMGVVYKARQTRLGRLVALKMILAGAQASEQDCKRFQAEAEAVARLQHPNIVQIYEVGESAGNPFFSMELVEGLSLAQRLDGNPLPATEAAPMVETLARAVHHAHERGIIHRDLKPANVLVQIGDGRSPIESTSRSDQAVDLSAKSALSNRPSTILKIADFGLAKQLDTLGGQTRTSAVIGTPDYIAPEQIAGSKKVGPAADIYALGCILYECLTGRPPFRNDTPLDTLLQVISIEPVPPSRLSTKVPRDLETICLKCLEKDPHARYATAVDLAEDLRRFIDGRPIAARPVGRLGRVWRWTRHNPMTATLIGTVAALLLFVAVGSSVAALYLRATLTDSERNRGRAENAERDAQNKLWRSYLEQARALRLSGQVGQRFEGLDTLANATRIARKLSVGEKEVLSLRNEAVACMALADVRFERALLENIPEKMPHVYWIAFDAPFDYFVYSDRQGNLSIRSVADAVETDHLAGPETAPGWVTLRFSPDGQWLYADYRWDRPEPHRDTAAVWEFRDGKLGRKIDLEHFCVFSPDSRLIAGAKPDGSIGVYELASGRQIKHFGKGKGVSNVLFQPAGRELAATLRPDARSIAVFDLETEKEILPRLVHDQPVVDMAWSGDGRLLAAASEDQRIYVYDRVQSRLQSVLEGHSALGIIVKFSHASDFLISSSWDGTTRLWDPVRGRQLVQAVGHFVDIRRDDRQMALMKSGTKTYDLGLWDVVGGWECRTLHHGLVGNRTPRPEHWGPTCVDFAPDGKSLVSSHLDGVRMWDVGTFTQAGFLPIPSTAFVRYQPTGNALFTYGTTGLSRWPLGRPAESAAKATGGDRLEAYPAAEVLRVGVPQAFDAPGNWLFPTFSCDRSGRRLIVVDYPNGRALLFDSEEPGKKIVLEQPGVNGAALSLDGRWAFTWKPAVADQSLIWAWDTVDGKVVWRAPAGETFGYQTPDGRWLVTTPLTNGPRRLWDVGSWTAGPTLLRPSDRPLFLEPSPDGTILASMEPGPPRFIHAKTGKELATLEAPRDPGSSILGRFSPDGRMFALATGNHTVHVWDLRAIRQGLADLDLDWDLPSYPPPVEKDAAKPVRLDVSGDVVEHLNQRDFRRGEEETQAKHWKEAIDSFSDVIARDKARGDAYHQRGWIHAELKQWRESEADFAKVAELSPDRAEPWYFRALFCLARDDFSGYRRTCTEMLSRFGQTPQPASAYWVAWTCALGPYSTAEPARAVHRAEIYVADAPATFDGLVVLGASLYRAGRLDEAAERLQAAVAADGSGNFQRLSIIYAWLYLAMVEQRRGQSAAAKEWLDRADDALTKLEPKDTADGRPDDSVPWNRRLIFQILHREAEAVLKEPL